MYSTVIAMAVAHVELKGVSIARSEVDKRLGWCFENELIDQRVAKVHGGRIANVRHPPKGEE